MYDEHKMFSDNENLKCDLYIVKQVPVQLNRPASLSSLALSVNVEIRNEVMGKMNNGSLLHGILNQDLLRQTLPECKYRIL